MQEQIRSAFKLLGRVALFIICLIMAVFSLYAHYHWSAIIAIALVSTNFMRPELLKKLFHIPRWVLVTAGGILWIVVMFFEA